MSDKARNGIASPVNPADIESLVRAFETCSIGPGEFSHRSHLAVSLWYLVKLPPDAAQTQMQVGLWRFLAHHGLQGYHETITLFWLKLVEQFVAEQGRGRPLAELVLELWRRYGHSSVIHTYYSKELLASDAARAQWQEPDLRPLDF